jgi:type II secretory pathway pseudopilin PulG
MSSLVTIIVAALPTVGTGTVAYFRWRSSARRQRGQREEAATRASQAAIEAARADAQQMRDTLLSSLNSTIERLEAMLRDEQRENERLRDEVVQNDRAERRSRRHEEGP